MLYRHLQHHNDTMNNDRRRKTSLTIILPLTLLQGFEKGYSRFACEKELETKHNWNILTPKLMAVNVVSFSFSWCSTGGPEAHSAGWWLPLLRLISIFFGPQFNQGSRGSLRPGVAFPTTSRPSPTPTLMQLPTWLPSWQRYIIVQCPLDLWNRMFNRHQAEITVMQFTGHSLPVRHSMRVSWDFLACPILLANFRPRDFLS